MKRIWCLGPWYSKMITDEEGNISLCESYNGGNTTLCESYNGGNFPQAGADYHFRSWTDATGAPAANLIPDPNLVLIEGWIDDAEYDRLQDDPIYVCDVIEERAAMMVMMTAKKEKTEKQLRDALKALGIPRGVVNSASTRRDLPRIVAGWCRGLSKRRGN